MKLCFLHRVSEAQVRREGILTFTFNVESAIAAAWSNVADDDFIGFLNSSLELYGFTRAVPVVLDAAFLVWMQL